MVYLLVLFRLDIGRQGFFYSGWMEYFGGRFPENLGDLSEEQGKDFT